jgi:hypothetical protein
MNKEILDLSEKTSSWYNQVYQDAFLDELEKIAAPIASGIGQVLKIGRRPNIAKYIKGPLKTQVTPTAKKTIESVAKTELSSIPLKGGFRLIPKKVSEIKPWSMTAYKPIYA